MSSKTPDYSAPEKMPLRLELAIYGAAMFSNSLGYMTMVVVPLWVITLNPSPLMIGIVLGSRHFLVFLYSIHGGAMMDRMDPRRIMVMFTWIGAVIPFFYPLTTWLWVLVLIQMIAGYSTAIGWIGAQAIIGQTLKGSAVHAGRMSAAVRIGALLGPPLTGAAWDFGGPWLSFGTLALWGAGLMASCLALPKTPPKPGTQYVPINARDFIPRLSDYMATFSLLSIPVIATVVMLAVIRIGGFSMQSSFYVIWLEQLGYTGTTIGLLMTVFSLFGGGTSLLAGPLMKRFSGAWLAIFAVSVCILMVTITPVLGSYALLMVAVAINGGLYGLGQPLMITMAARGAGSQNQGKAVGLRTSANRLAATFIPIIMGAVVQFSGLENSFYIMGGALLCLVALIAVYAKRSGATK